MKFIPVLMIVLSVTVARAETLEQFKNKAAEREKNNECGKVIEVSVNKNDVEVVFHPEKAQPLTNGGYNRGFVMKSGEGNLELLTQVGMKALELKSLKFCYNLSDFSNGKREYYLTSAQ